MDALKQLREQAARKRDSVIQVARNEYHDTLKEIDTLGMRLNLDVRTTRGAKRKKSIYELIIEHMPKDRTFAHRDIMPILCKAEPHRKFIDATVRTIFKKLIDDGKVRKVRKSDNGFMLWAAPECPIDEMGPLATVSISDAIEYVLRRQGPLRPVEILLAVQALGYRADAAPRSLLATLSMALKRYPKRFRPLTSGKWSAV